VVSAFHRAALGLLVLAAGCALDDRSLTIIGTGGGHSDAGGASGADGASDAATLPVCQGIPVTSAVITEFTDAVQGQNAVGDPDLEFGTGSDGLGGGSYTYHAPLLAAPVLSLVPTADGQALAVTADPGVPHDSSNQWVGFGFGICYSLGTCIDARRYEGVQFTIAGSLGTCELLFGVVFSEDQDVTFSAATGACAAGAACYPPHSAALVPDAAGVVEVPFASINRNGSPTSTVDPKTIAGIEWQLNVPLAGTPCSASFTVDDVKFF
jgi:hypothetical protein